MSIAVKFSSVLVPTEELPRLHDAAAALGFGCPKLGAWLTEFAQAEEARRMDSLFNPQAACYPGLNPAGWSNADVAEALVSCEAMTRTCEDAMFGSLFDALLRTFCIIASARLMGELPAPERNR